MTIEILAALISANIAGSLAILLILALRRPFRRIFGAWAAYGLWIAPPLAALATFLPALPRQAVAAQVQSIEALPPELIEAALILLTLTPPEPVQSAFNWLPLVIAAWAIGASAGLAFMFWRHQRSVRALGSLTRRAGDQPHLYRAPSASSPALVGLIRPRIILPEDFEDRFDEDERRMILAHEQEHLRSHHARVNGLTTLLVCLNWFNPLVHLAGRTLRIDQELACDAAVLARRDADRRTYASALLKTQFAPSALPMGCHWPPAGESPLKARISMLTHALPSTSRRIAGGAMIAVLVSGTAFAAWATQPARAEAVQDVIEAAPLPPLPPTPPAPPAVAAPAPVPAPAPTPPAPAAAPEAPLRIAALARAQAPEAGRMSAEERARLREEISRLARPSEEDLAQLREAIARLDMISVEDTARLRESARAMRAGEISEEQFRARMETFQANMPTEEQMRRIELMAQRLQPDEAQLARISELAARLAPSEEEMARLSETMERWSQERMPELEARMEEVMRRVEQRFESLEAEFEDQ